MKKYNRGNTLAVALIMLLALTLIGVAGLRMTQSELKMTAAMQLFTTAFFNAESAIELSIASKAFTDSMMPVTEPIEISPVLAVPTTRQFLDRGPVPGGGFSISDNKFAAYHFGIHAEGRAGEAHNTARVDLVQGIYVIARGGN